MLMVSNTKALDFPIVLLSLLKAHAGKGSVQTTAVMGVHSEKQRGDEGQEM